MFVLLEDVATDWASTGVAGPDVKPARSPGVLSELGKLSVVDRDGKCLESISSPLGEEMELFL